MEIYNTNINGLDLIKYGKFMYAHEDIIKPIITFCRESTPKSIEFRSKLSMRYNID